MLLRRIRNVAWLLVLVLVTGLTMPMLASAAPREATPPPHTHHHASGVEHTHSGKPGPDTATTPAHRTPGQSHHCPDCTTDAACALSCLGLAVLPITAQPTPSASIAVWSPTASNAPPGTPPHHDIDPPRPALNS